MTEIKEKGNKKYKDFVKGKGFTCCKFKPYPANVEKMVSS
jgi:hypothetical protein